MRSVNTSVRKAVFPAAGLGTRFLPATKAQPKEMLPLVDKPIIQYSVEEAVASGVSNIILVTGRGKNAIEDHFDVSVELETYLEARGKRDQLAEIRKISNLINFAYVRQGEPLGLGHAVLVARELVGDEPFAVLLGDDVIDADPPAIKQLIDVFDRVKGPVLAVERVPRENISSYGVIAVDTTVNLGPGVFQVRDLVEKRLDEVFGLDVTEQTDDSQKTWFVQHLAVGIPRLDERIGIGEQAVARCELHVELLVRGDVEHAERKISRAAGHGALVS